MLMNVASQSKLETPASSETLEPVRGGIEMIQRMVHSHHDRSCAALQHRISPVQLSWGKTAPGLTGAMTIKQ